MNKFNQNEREDLSNDYHDLMSSQRSLLLATASEEAIPDISYAPFVRDDAGIFYIYVSRLARHTAHLLKNSQASVMFIRSESDSSNIYARERVIYQCGVTEIARTDPDYNVRIRALGDRFGEIINLLQSLPDFHLIALKPTSGRYIAGFGRAFAIDPKTDVLTPVEPG